jgi:hypothetical protein
VRRSGRLLLGLPLVAGGALLALYGVFAIVYNGDCRSDCADVYVTLLGRRLSANAVGWVTLAISALWLGVGAWVLRGSARRGPGEARGDPRRR